MALLCNSILQKIPSHDPRMFHMIHCSITILTITNFHINSQLKLFYIKYWLMKELQGLSTK